MLVQDVANFSLNVFQNGPTHYLDVSGYLRPSAFPLAPWGSIKRCVRWQHLKKAESELLSSTRHRKNKASRNVASPAIIYTPFFMAVLQSISNTLYCLKGFFHCLEPITGKIGARVWSCAVRWHFTKNWLFLPTQWGETHTHRGLWVQRVCVWSRFQSICIYACEFYLEIKVFIAANPQSASLQTK